VLGICNGFQVLCESHLLPGALIRTTTALRLPRPRLRIESDATVWTRRYAAGEEIVIPLKNQEGGFVAGHAHAGRAEGEGRVVARYLDVNPNGSYRDIAGISNAAGTVVGLMPHPEHAIDAMYGPTTDGLRFFLSALEGVLAAWSVDDSVNTYGVDVDSGLGRRGRAWSSGGGSGHRDRARETPDVAQPWSELGLKADEYARIHEIPRPPPDASELAMYSVMWSEHCSYKSSKVHLRQFGEKTTEEMREHLLVGIGENAGRGGHRPGLGRSPSRSRATTTPATSSRTRAPRPGWAASSATSWRWEPAGRDHGPAAVRRSGPPGHPPGAARHRRRRRRLRQLPGLPNIGGEVVFDPCYQGNPLVNALCVGAHAARGHPPARTPRRGQPRRPVRRPHRRRRHRRRLVLASETFDEGGPAKRPACRSATRSPRRCSSSAASSCSRRSVVEGIQDLGGAGLSCATSELASNGDGGMLIHLDRVPLRDPRCGRRRSS
jgi:hypothetical protein